MSRGADKAGVFPAWVGLLAACLSIFGCSGGTDVGNPTSIHFGTDRAALAYISDQYAQSAQPMSLNTLSMDASESWVSGAYSADQRRFETDTITAAGPDRPDYVKTDGRCLYIQSGNEVRIVTAIPMETMREIGRIQAPGPIRFLDFCDTRLVIFYAPPGGDGEDWIHYDGLKLVDVGLPYWLPVKAKTGILVMDIGNPESPNFVNRMEVEGNLLSSLTAEGNLYLLLQFLPDLPVFELWHDGTESGRQRTVEINRDALKSLTIDDVVPDFAAYNEAGVWIRAGRLIPSENLVKPAKPNGGTIVSLVCIPLGNSSISFAAIGLVADIHYARLSGNAACLVSTQYQNQSGMSASAGNGTGDYQSLIYKFGISGTALTFKGEQSVEGHLLDPFSFNSDRDILRIATTTGRAGSSDAVNYIYCLAPSGEKIAVVGSAAVAPGKRLHSARFIGNKGYLSTGMESAPLITMDLSVPDRPKAVGEILVPGGDSAFLYPIEDRYLLTLGGELSGNCGSSPCRVFRISLFDLRDLSSPRLLAAETVGEGGTGSEVFDNPGAFAFRVEDRLLALPLNLFQASSESGTSATQGQNAFNGILLYGLTKPLGIELKGKLALPDQANAGVAGNRWLRGVFIKQGVYAVSADGVKAAPVDNMRLTVFYPLP